MKSTSEGTGFLRSRRGVVLMVAGAALVGGLGATGLSVVLAKDAEPPARPTPAVAPSPEPSVAPDPVETPTPTPEPEPEPVETPAPDPNALADGVYPAFVREVDLGDASVTVDVLQVFTGADMHDAAIEDGVPWKDVRFDPVYIRNENPLLRTLPVAEHAYIKLIGVCTHPELIVNLERLREAVTPFTDFYYYELTVADGSIVRIDQSIAESAC